MHIPAMVLVIIVQLIIYVNGSFHEFWYLSNEYSILQLTKRYEDLKLTNEQTKHKQLMYWHKQNQRIWSPSMARYLHVQILVHWEKQGNMSRISLPANLVATYIILPMTLSVLAVTCTILELTLDMHCLGGSVYRLIDGVILVEQNSSTNKMVWPKFTVKTKNYSWKNLNKFLSNKS